MQRRPRPATPVRHSPFTVRSAPAAPSLVDLLYTFELAGVLESHAVARAAAAAHHDLQAARGVFADLERAIEARHLSGWAALEIQLHRALNDQGGNLVLAAMAERTLREGLTACPILPPDVLRALHAQHGEILRCVEAGDADAAMQYTHAHVLLLRDAVVGARPATSSAGIRLHS
ncbi:MAG: FCD domain-containing protein [Chloroflexi bacterium]|nr:FCD domain-containing protein [Chloroflexota bacterium]